MHTRVRQIGWLLVVGWFWLVQLIYTVSPIDFIPDFLPFVGVLDDLTAMLISLSVTVWSVRKALEEDPDPATIEGPTLVHPTYEPVSSDEVAGW